jgi:hypothetical protein
VTTTDRARPAYPIILLAALFAPIAGAARADDPAIVETWKTPVAERPVFTKLLIVGITRDAPARRAFEDRFVSLLRGRSVEGSTSYPLVPDLDRPGETKPILDKLFAQHVDGVVTVNLVPLDGGAGPVWAKSWRPDLEKPTLVRAYVEESLKRPRQEVAWFGAEVTLWELATGNRVWAARTYASKLKALRKNASSLVQDVMTELVAENLL